MARLRWRAARGAARPSEWLRRAAFVGSLVVVLALLIWPIVAAVDGLEHARSAYALAAAATDQRAQLERAVLAARDQVAHVGTGRTAQVRSFGLRIKLQQAVEGLEASAETLWHCVSDLREVVHGDMALHATLVDMATELAPRVDAFAERLRHLSTVDHVILERMQEGWPRVNTLAIEDGSLRRDAKRFADLAAVAAERQLARARNRLLISVFIVAAGAVLGLIALHRLHRHLGLAQAEAMATRRDLRYMADHDEATGLWSRTWLKSRIAERLRGSRPAAVVLVTCDGLRTLQDGCGETAGAAILRRLVERLAAAAQPSLGIARIDVDTFAVLLDPDRIEPAFVGAAILERLSAPINAGGARFGLTPKLGWARDSVSIDSFDRLLSAANLALGEAKRTAGSGLHGFRPALRERLQDEQALQSALRRALDCGELRLFYQPKVRLTDARLVGFEALLRWQHPERGLLTPGAFLWAIEGTSLEEPVTDFVTQAAIDQLATWAKPAALAGTVAINLGAAAFATRRPLRRLLDAIERAELPPGAVQVEVTERVVLNEDPETIYARLTELRTFGIDVALDDFGTGHASLTHLSRMPSDTVKLDRSFVHYVDRFAASASITRHLIATLHELDKKVIAEGIERREEWIWLKEHRCDLGQGYLFARPLPANEATALIQAPDLRPASRDRTAVA